MIESVEIDAAVPAIARRSSEGDEKRLLVRVESPTADGNHRQNAINANRTDRLTLAMTPIATPTTIAC